MATLNTPVTLALSLATIAVLAACAGERARAPSDSSRVSRAAVSHAAVSGAVVSAATRVDSGAGDAWRASVHGVGAVTFGASLDSAARVAGGTVAHAPGGSCGFVSLRDVPHGARFMVSHDTVVRVDVDSALVPTDAGARVGMREDSVQRLYAGKLRVMPHKYVRGGHYLISIPGAPADTMHQLIFETDGERVTRYRAGLAPYVSYVEGCG